MSKATRRGVMMGALGVLFAPLVKLLPKAEAEASDLLSSVPHPLRYRNHINSGPFRGSVNVGAAPVEVVPGHGLRIKAWQSVNRGDHWEVTYHYELFKLDTASLG